MPRDRSKPFDLKLLQFSLRLGGSITFMIGSAHLLFPSYGYPPTIVESMEPLIRDHFYYLATYAIATFLLSLGTISILFSRLVDVRSGVLISGVLAALWLARFFLELYFPVEIQLFHFARPSTVLLPTIGFMAALYLVAAVGALRRLAG